MFESIRGRYTLLTHVGNLAQKSSNGGPFRPECCQEARQMAIYAFCAAGAVAADGIVKIMARATKQKTEAARNVNGAPS